MKNEYSLLATILLLVFSITGFIAHLSMVLKFNSHLTYVFIVSLIYVGPLLIETVEDFSVVSAYSLPQFIIDLLALLLGLLFLVVLFCVAVYSQDSNQQVIWIEHKWVGYLLGYLPLGFVLRYLFSLRIEIRKRINFAKAVFPNEIE